MAKKVKATIKVYCPAAQANPAPPIGPALGQHGLNIMEFCKAFNEKTKGKEGVILPVVITAYEDRSFTFIIKSPAGAILLKQAANIAKATGAQSIVEKLKSQLSEQIQKITGLEGQNKKLQEMLEELKKKLGGEMEIPSIPKL